MLERLQERCDELDKAEGHWVGLVVIGAAHMMSRPITTYSRVRNVNRFRVWSSEDWRDRIDWWLNCP